MAATAVPLPPGMLQFCDPTGAPYAGGLVYTYIPGTTTAKTTWQDPAQATPNANPITLDANGRAVIWGSGQYRQQLFDQFGNLIWDQVTEAADPNYVVSLAPPFVGDSGAGGVQGLVPAPAAGTAAAGDYLTAAGTWGPLNVVVPASPAANQAGTLFVPFRSLTGSDSTDLTDAGGWIAYGLVPAITLTITSQATSGWRNDVFTQIGVSNLFAAGAITLTPAAGVTLVWPGSSSVSSARTLNPNGQCVLTRLNGDAWTVIGAGLS